MTSGERRDEREGTELPGEPEISMQDANKTSKPPQSPKRNSVGLNLQRLKIVLGTLIAVGIVAFMAQNWTDTTITFIWELTLPRWLLYSALFGMGLLMGWIIKSFSVRAKRRALK